MELDGDENTGHFTNLLATINFKCPAPNFQVNYVYAFLGLYQYTKTSFKAVNEYALVGESKNAMYEPRFQKTVMFTGLDDKVFPHPLHSVYQQQVDVCMVLRVLYVDNEGCEVFCFGAIPLVKHILARGGQLQRAIVLYAAPGREHIPDFLIHKVVCNNGEYLVTQGTLTRFPPKYFIDVTVKASPPSILGNVLNSKKRNPFDVLSHSLVSTINREERNDIVVNVSIANLPSSEYVQSMQSHRINFSVSLVIKFAGINKNSRSSLVNTPVIKRTLRYAAGKQYGIKEFLRACALPPPTAATKSQKKSEQSFWSDNFSIDAKMIQEKILTKKGIELYLHITTNDPGIKLSNDMILLASNHAFTSELLDATFSHKVGVTIPVSDTLTHRDTDKCMGGLVDFENEENEIQLSVTANLISSSYSFDPCINQIKRDGFNATNINDLTNRFWNNASLTEVAYFTLDILNTVFQYICRKDNFEISRQENVMLDELSVFEILMVYASLLSLGKNTKLGAIDIKPSSLVKIKYGVENKNGEWILEKIESPYTLISLLETYIRDTIKRNEASHGDDKFLSLNRRGIGGNLPQLLHGLAGRINVSIHGWYNAIKTITAIIFAKLGDIHRHYQQHDMPNAIDKVNFEEVVNKLLNSYRSLYTYIGRSLTPILLMESNNAKDAFQTILLKVIDSARFIQSTSANTLLHPYGEKIGTTLHGVALAHYFEGVLHSRFDSLPGNIATVNQSYASIYVHIINQMMMTPHFQKCFRVSSTIFSMVLFSYFTKCHEKANDQDNIEFKTYISYFFNLQIVAETISKPILEHTYRNFTLFYCLVSNSIEILQSLQPNAVSNAHYLLFRNMLDIMILKRDGRKWELFSSLGFSFISAIRSRPTQQPLSANDNYQLTIANFFKCMLKFSTISIASLVDFETLKDSNKAIVPLASPNPEECVWFLNLILLAGDVEYKCRGIVGECLKNRFAAWNNYSTHSNLTVQEQTILKLKFVQVFKPITMLLCKCLLSLFLGSRWSRWFNPWHVFYQFEALLDFSDNSSGINVVGYLPLKQCLEICEFFAITWSRSLALTVVEKKMLHLKKIFLQNDGNDNDANSDWVIFLRYFRILRNELLAYPSWTDNYNVDVALKSINDDNLHSNDMSEHLGFKLQDPPKSIFKTKSLPPPKLQTEKNEKTNNVANNSVKKEQSKPTVIADKKAALSKLKSLRLARQAKAAKSKNIKQKKNERAVSNGPKRSSYVGFVNPLAALDFSTPDSKIGNSKQSQPDQSMEQKKTEQTTTNGPKRSSYVGFVNPLAALDFSTPDSKIGDSKQSQPDQSMEQKKTEQTTTNGPKRSSYVGFVNPLAALDFSTPDSKIGDNKRREGTQPLENAFVNSVSVGNARSKDVGETSAGRRPSSDGFVNPLVALESSSKTSVSSSSAKKSSSKRSSLVGFVNPLASGASIKGSENVFASPPSHSHAARETVAVSTEKTEAMKYARSLNVFVGPDDAILLKKYLGEDKGVFEAQLMEKTGEVQVNMIITPSEISMTEIRSEMSKTKKKKWTIMKQQKKKGETALKTIPLAAITNTQESMAPGAFTLYVSTGQAMYMMSKQRGLLLGCIKAFQARDKSNSSGW